MTELVFSVRIPLRKSREYGGSHEVSTYSAQTGHMVGVVRAFGIRSFDVRPSSGNTSAQSLYILDRGGRTDNNVACHQTTRALGKARLFVAHRGL
jgi:hypothetical protein